jgi:hypothetical protein
MKKYINIFCLFAFATLLQSCIGSAHHEKLNSGYYLSAIDVKEDMVIGFQDRDYGIGIIEATVFAVGQNDEFIIAKQHPKVSPSDMNKTVINYFIIPLKNKVSQSPEKNIYGPLTLEEFERKRKKLNIENLDFTFVFKDLE